MSLEDTTALAVPEADNSLSMISQLRGSDPDTEETPSEAPETKATPTPAPTPAPAVTPAEVVDPEDDTEAENRRNAVLREIAMDPAASRQYVHEQQYGPSEPAAEIELPFDEDSFDPTNIEHQKALHRAQLLEFGGPMFDMVERLNQRFEQQDRREQEKQTQAVEQLGTKKTIELLDTYVPGFADLADKYQSDTELTPVEDAVIQKAVNAEAVGFHQATLHIIDDYCAKNGVQLGPEEAQTAYTNVHAHVVRDVNIRAHIAQQIGPEIKKYAKGLGLAAQSKTTKQPLTDEQKRVMKQESYVESSNAVPADTSTKFDKAHNAKDVDGMIGLLRAR